jgi:DnaJ domain
MTAATTTHPYKLLQVDGEASPEVIEAAYRRLAKMYHPDVSSGRDTVARMAEINAAHDALKDPVSRRAIDQELLRGAASARPRAASATPRPTERPAPRPVDYEPSRARSATSAAQPHAQWHETLREGRRAQRAIAIIAFLIFVITPLFDRFTEPAVARLATGMRVWVVILCVQLVLDANNWNTTPLGEVLRLSGRLLKLLVRASVGAAKTLGATLEGRLRES